LNKENKSIDSLLDITKKILEQNTSIMKKQETLETTLTQLIKDVRTLQSSYENLKSKARENGYEWWQ
ncbi:6110_t:CDS:1, partial [Cetraspora pellucida]